MKQFSLWAAAWRHSPLLYLLPATLFLLAGGGASVSGQIRPDISPWPGESWMEAVDLTPLNPILWQKNLSGVFWNSRTGRLWLANNSGTFSVLKIDASGQFQKERDYPVGGDLEAITQSPARDESVFLLDERAGEIREYAVDDGKLVRSWVLKSWLGKLKNDGPEGLAFVPDAWLARRGFQDAGGQPYPQSVHGDNGFGGLFLVAVQAVDRPQAGYVYAVDLKKDGTWIPVGKYQTARRESCELAFDNESGWLYILHNIEGNTLEMTDLSSVPQGADRRWVTRREVRMPSGSNIEGFSIGPAGRFSPTPGETWCFITDDDNARGALRWFRRTSF